MIKLSLIEEKEHPEFSELIARIKAGRGGRYTYPFTLLLHSPDIAAAWLDQVTAVRWKTNLDGPLREMVIIRIGILNRVSYVSKAHGTVYAPKENMSAKQISAIEDWKNSDLFSASQRAALAYTDAMTLEVQVPEAIQDELQRHLSERQIIELTVLIGTYNMHTRVFQALEIERRSAISKGDPPTAARSSAPTV